MTAAAMTMTARMASSSGIPTITTKAASVAESARAKSVKQPARASARSEIRISFFICASF